MKIKKQFGMTPFVKGTLIVIGSLALLTIADNTLTYFSVREQARTITSPSPTPEASLVDQINAVRVKAGKAPLQEVQAFDTAAGLKAQDMVNKSYRNHTYPGEAASTAWKFLDPELSPAHGYSFGENLAECQKTDSQAVTQWVASPGHYANIIGDYTYFGSAVRVDPIDSCRITVTYFVKQTQ